MSREKTHKANFRDKQRRRSPRISAADAWKEIQQKPFSSEQKPQQEVFEEGEGGASRTSTRVKRKFGEASFNSTLKIHKQVWKGRDNPQGEDNSADFVRWTTGGELEKSNGNHKHEDSAIFGKSFKLPEKHTLELILDVLQRRDTYEIFSEPVDPDEVEDYYEIIKEPMDFATMRAKLHEGMYQNLEQFEHDVFLISENAMHFNSTATIYFRQARAIHELAKKVFHVLGTDPDNFISEFSGTRRRSMRKALSVDNHSNGKVNNVRGVVSSKKRICSPLTRTAKGKPGGTGVTAHGESGYYDCLTGCHKPIWNHPALNEMLPFDTETHLSLAGSRGGGSSSFVDTDRRSTYQQWSSSLHNENNSLGFKFLGLMNEGDISYRDSLMSFVKDLGSRAQMVAKQKLQGQHQKFPMPKINGRFQSQGYQVPSAFATIRFAKSTSFIPQSQPADNVIDLTGAEDGEETNGTKSSTRVEEKTDISAKSATRCIAKQNKLSQTRKSTVNRNTVCTKSMKTSADEGKADDDALPVILALENSHSVAQELKSRNKKCSVAQTSETPSHITGPCSSELKNPVPTASQFCFDIPFLKARLNQMKSWRQNEFSKSKIDTKRTSSPTEKRGFYRTVNYSQPGESSNIGSFLNNLSWQSRDNLEANLVLQL